MKFELADHAERLTGWAIATLAALVLAFPSITWATELTGSVPDSSLTMSSISFTFEITNSTTAVSSPVRVEVWAFPAPYTGGALDGIRILTQQSFSNGIAANGGTRTEVLAGSYNPPPAGTWYFSIIATEFDNASTDDGYVPRLYSNFPSPLSFGVPPPPPPITPQVGLWWNPNESGTGYALDVKHQVLVVTVYSYTPTGQPIWYLVAGAITNNTFVGTLDKYAAGQCISCAYRPATLNGNDGIMTITFTSATSATMTLPGGRSFAIEPQAF